MKENNPAHIKIDLSARPKEKIESLFVKWAVNSGRIIIILTELIALAALSYRFVIDGQISNLQDDIKQQQLFVSSQADKEKEYRGVQERLALIKQTTTQEAAKITVMNSIISAQSSNVFSATNIIINQNEFSLEKGTALSIFSLNSFINSMKQNQNVTSISLDQITTNAQGIQFKMTINLKDTTL